MAIDPWGESWQALIKAIHLKQDNNGAWLTECDPGEPGYQDEWQGIPRRSVTTQEGACLSRIVNGRSVLEIGTGLGVSTRYMAETAAWVVTLDVDAWVQRHIWPSFEDLENVQPVNEPPRGLWIDLVFIDGNHAAQSVRQDIERARRLMRHGLLLFHDTRRESVRQGIVEAQEGPLFELPTANGLGLIVV